MARRYDPERRGRIIDAAIRVVGAKGIAGLSHRSVAAEAGLSVAHLALAWAAREAGLPLTVFTPRNAPRTKLQAIAGFGADLRPVA